MNKSIEQILGEIVDLSVVHFPFKGEFICKFCLSISRILPLRHYHNCIIAQAQDALKKRNSYAVFDARDITKGKDKQ